MNIVTAFESTQIRFVDHPTGAFDFGIIAEDLAIVLEASSGTNLVRSVDDEWRGLHNVMTPGGTQPVSVIWEPGVYQLLAKSRKPKAKPFQKWLFEEVLPAIRKTGSYGAGQAAQTESAAQPAPVLPQRDSVDFVNAADKLGALHANQYFKPHLLALLADAIVDDLELMRNQRRLNPGAGAVTPKKEYTIVKVRAKELGYSSEQIGRGCSLGAFVANILPCAFKERIGKYEVKHYEVTPALDNTIHAYFNKTSAA